MKIRPTEESLSCRYEKFRRIGVFEMRGRQRLIVPRCVRLVRDSYLDFQAAPDPTIRAALVWNLTSFVGADVLMAEQAAG